MTWTPITRPAPGATYDKRIDRDTLDDIVARGPQPYVDGDPDLLDAVEAAMFANLDAITAQLSQFTPTTTLDMLLAQKASVDSFTQFQTSVNAALALKADITALTSGLATKADLSYVNAQLALKATATEVTAALALKADLVGGKVPTSQLPSVTIGEIFPVASQAAMLALSAQVGDVAIRTDLTTARRFLLTGDPTVLGDWVRLNEPTTAGVQSINNQTGNVVLGYADVGAAPIAHVSDATNPHGVTKAQVGLGNVNDVAVPAPTPANAGKAYTVSTDGATITLTTLPSGGSTQTAYDASGVSLGTYTGVKAGTNIALSVVSGNLVVANTAGVTAAGFVSLRSVAGQRTGVAVPVPGSATVNNFTEPSPQATELFVRFTPTEAFSFNYVRLQLQDIGATNLIVSVYDGVGTSGTAHGATLATVTVPIGAATNYAGTAFDIALGSTVAAQSGVPLVIGLKSSAGGRFVLGVYSAVITYTKVTLNGVYTSPSNAANGTYPGVGFLIQQDVSKGTVNSLDPGDFPVVTAATALAGNNGALVVNDAAKTAILTWKFSDGTTKSVSLV